MISFDYKKYLKISSLFKKQSFDITESPMRDWKWILPVFIVLNVISMSFNAYMFFKVNTGSFSKQGSVVGGSETINRSNLERVFSVFDEKEKKLDELEANPLNRPDPSL